MKPRGLKAPVLRLTLVIATVAGSLLFGPEEPVLAQSPFPNHTFRDYAPSTFVTGHQGIVVEGLGGGACAYSLSSVETATVRYVNAGIAVISEVSPQVACQTVSGYQNYFDSLADYVEAHASHAARFWGGIMVDEEDGFGFSVSQINAMNDALASTMAGTPGISTWYTEDFSSLNAWSENTWNTIVQGSIPAPQIATTYMKNLVNHAAINTGILVTWSDVYPAPYNTESYSVNSIGGSPYAQNFGFGGSTYYWDNRFTRA